SARCWPTGAEGRGARGRAARGPRSPLGEGRLRQFRAPRRPKTVRSPGPPGEPAMKKTPRAALVLLASALCACASSPEGPVVPEPPSVEVAGYGSELITPSAIQFGAQVLIHNRMRGPLAIERVDYY